tara:strand:+ start:402 stop:542 length:141 start_codon:yes stop_codon:yes gene_type:complete
MSAPSDLDHMIETLRRCEVLKESEVKLLCNKAMEIFNGSLGSCFDV